MPRSELPILILQPDAGPVAEVTSRLFYSTRLANMLVPSWRDDPSYFWADEVRRKREGEPC